LLELGFFDDSADVPGQSLLYFTLRGTCQQNDDGSLQLQFSKLYQQQFEQARDAGSVEYTARLLPAMRTSLIGDVITIINVVVVVVVFVDDVCCSGKTMQHRLSVHSDVFARTCCKQLLI
jgi:hypothetical protein